MKINIFSILFLNYIIISSSALLGGWKKGSFKENDYFIDGAFKKAFEIYKAYNQNSDIDYLQRLTLYRQMSTGINYRMCFIDLKSDLNVVHEYIITGPNGLGDDRIIRFNLFERNTYKAKTDTIDSNDKRFPRIYNTIFGFLKNSGENILFIKKIEIVETNLDNFFIVYAQGEKKEHIYVAGQSKENYDEYEGYGILQ